MNDELSIFHSNSLVKKPILIVEGIDPLNHTAAIFYYNKAAEWIQAQHVDEGYDIYMLNFNDGGKDLRDNAMSVLGTLRFIANKYELSEGIKLLGISMGGVVSRYALAWAEENEIEHFTTMYMSLDSPQRGAQINSSMQSAAYNYASNSDGNFAGQINSVLDCQASKQLLRYNVYESYAPYSNGSEVFCEFFGELNEEENFIANNNYGIPVTILNGDGYPHSQNNIFNFGISNGKTSVTGNLENFNDFIFVEGDASFRIRILQFLTLYKLR